MADATRVGRVLGVDLGTVRIGLASSDRTGTLASPLTVLNRSGDEAVDHQTIVGMARETECKLIVVGLPLTLQGKIGPAARSVMNEVAELAKLAHADNIPVETWDERFTTVIAEQGLRETKAKLLKKTNVDAAAATVILQSWIEAHS
ncbi:MAG: Holliday junction resolvase RuvX [Acidimicrobiia bacterium]